MAQENPPIRVVKSNFFRVIQGSGIQIATSANQLVIQIFSDYPDLDIEQIPNEPTPLSPVTPTAMIREIEVNINIPLSAAAELGELLTEIGQQQAREGEAP